MTAKAKRKKNSAYSAHEYALTKITPLGEQVDTITVLGSRDAFHRQIEMEDEGYFIVVHNQTLNIEEYRTPGCEK